VQQLVAEISSQRPHLQKRHPELKTTEGRPRKYYYSEKSDVAEVAAAEGVVAVPIADSSDAKLGEHAMYPLLSLYLWEEFGVYSKRIDEKRSSNKRGPNGSRWLYPDVVGMEDLGAEWHQEEAALLGRCRAAPADHRQHQRAAIGTAQLHRDGGLAIVLRLGQEDAGHIGLRVAVVQREQLDWTCTITRWPGRKVWLAWGRAKPMPTGVLAGIGLGCSKLSR